jgi:hypothetical protein
MPFLLYAGCLYSVIHVEALTGLQAKLVRA